jgi:hypothetical protein
MVDEIALAHRNGERTHRRVCGHGARLARSPVGFADLLARVRPNGSRFGRSVPSGYPQTWRISSPGQRTWWNAAAYAQEIRICRIPPRQSGTSCRRVSLSRWTMELRIGGCTPHRIRSVLPAPQGVGVAVATPTTSSSTDSRSVGTAQVVILRWVRS